MAAIANVNGRICDEQDARVSVFDHGFLFGEGVYEVIRTYNSNPFLLDRHLLRLQRSAQQLALHLPVTDAEYEQSIVETIASHRARFGGAHPGGEYYIRTLLTRGVGDMTYDPASGSAPTLVTIVKGLPVTPEEVYERGVRIALVSVVRNMRNSLNPAIKSNNLLNNALATREAMRTGAFESLMRNHRGELAEGAQSNIFVVKHGRVLTPSLDTGILEGITRQFVLELAASVGIPAGEATLHDDDLIGADEAFLTVTTREIVPVVRVDDHAIGGGSPGAVTRRLHEEFRRRAPMLADTRLAARGASASSHRDR
jgi:branched-chain amino acid aminotransferase